MGLTGISTGLISWILCDGTVTQVVAATVYPIGFLAVIVGRAQLFTENTMYPVALVLTEWGYLIKTLKLWAVVFVGNWLGSVLFALLVVKTTALDRDARETLIGLGVRAVDHPLVGKSCPPSLRVRSLSWTTVPG